jgi:sec-independent protein translocase protein TatA
MDFFGIGPWEILLILIVALIVVGPGKLPGIARTMGRTVRAIRRASSELTSAVTRELEAAEKAEKQPPPAQPEASRAVESKEGRAPESTPTEPGGAPPAK